jgi:hypothetical protein
LQELDPIRFDQIDAAVFLCDAARPNVRAEIFQRLWMTDTFERIAQRGLDEFEQPLGRASFGVHPITQIFQELWLEHRQVLGFRLQGRGSLPGIRPSSAEHRPRVPVPVPPAGARHF